MNVLFYVEPLIELGRPDWKAGWLEHWTYPIAEKLMKAGDSVQVVASESLSFFVEKPTAVPLTVCSHAEMTHQQQWSYLQLSRAWFEKTYSNEMLEYYQQMMLKKLAGFQPDLIITYTEVPFLAALYPSATILHREYGMYSRTPFPETFFLDSLGTAGGGAGAAAHKIFELGTDFKVTDVMATKVAELRQATEKAIVSNNPFQELFSIWRQKFSKLVLLPCQFSAFYLFDSHKKFENQFDFVVFCLDRIPQDIGVVVTLHPEHGVLSKDAIKFLKTKYPNFLYSEIFEGIYAGTQFIVPLIDAVVTVSSTVALQCLLWRKKIISIGSVFLKGIADTHKFEELPTVLANEYVAKDGILYWLSNNYSFPAKYAFDRQNLLNLQQKLKGYGIQLGIDEILALYQDNQFIDGFIEEINKSHLTLRQHVSAGVVRLRVQSEDAREKVSLFELQENKFLLEEDFFEKPLHLQFGQATILRFPENVSAQCLEGGVKLSSGDFYVSNQGGYFHVKNIVKSENTWVCVLAAGEDGDGQAFQQMQAELIVLKTKLDSIYNSKSWKVVRQIQRLKSGLFNLVRRSNKKTKI